MMVVVGKMYCFDCGIEMVYDGNNWRCPNCGGKDCYFEGRTLQVQGNKKVMRDA